MVVFIALQMHESGKGAVSETTITKNCPIFAFKKTSNR